MSESMFVNIDKLVESEKAFIKAEKHLNNAVNYLNNINNVPSDFKYSADLKKITTEIKSQILDDKFVELNDIRKMKINAYKGAERRVNALVSQFLGTIPGNGTANTPTVAATKAGDTAVEIKGKVNENKLTMREKTEYTKVVINANLSKILIEAKSLIANVAQVGTGMNLSNAKSALYCFKTPEGELVAVGTKKYEEFIKNNIKLSMVESAKYKDIQKSISNNYSIKSEEEVRKIVSLMALDGNKALYAEAIKQIVSLNSFKTGTSIPGFTDTTGYSNGTTNASIESSVKDTSIKASTATTGETTKVNIEGSVQDTSVKGSTTKSSETTDIEKEFKETFGFNLNTTNSNGNKVTNYEGLYADMWLYVNGDSVLVLDKNGKTVVNPEAVTIGKNSVMTIKINMTETNASKIKQLINEYLEFKGFKLTA